jgi:hypothetical protein
MGTVTLLATARRSSTRSTHLTNLLEQAITTDDGNRAAKLIRNSLGIESNEVANYCFPKAYLKPAPNDYLQRWPVSKRVNSSKADADDPSLIDRVQSEAA